MTTLFEVGNPKIIKKAHSRTSIYEGLRVEFSSLFSVGSAIRKVCYSRASFKYQFGTKHCHSRGSIVDPYIAWIENQKIEDNGYDPVNTPSPISYGPYYPPIPPNQPYEPPTPTRGKAANKAGASIVFPGHGDGDVTNSFSLTKNFNGSMQWSASIPKKLAINFEETVKCYLKINYCGAEYRTPPLLATMRDAEEGIGVGQMVSINGTDYTSWLLSKKTIDQPTFLKMTSGEILRQLLNPTSLTSQQNALLQQQLAEMVASGPMNAQQQQEYNAMAAQSQLAAQITGIQICGAPRYYIEEYSNYKGNMLEAIARILHDGGYGYYINSQGNINCIPLKDPVGSMGNTLIRKVRESYNASEKITQLMIIKQSPVRTHYEFVWTESGFKNDVKFDVPMVSVNCYDRSVVGYLDLLALFDSENTQNAGLVGQIIFHPNEHREEHYPPVNSSGPIRAATLVVYSPKISLVPGQKIYAKLVCEGIPYGISSNIDLQFKVIYNTGESLVLMSPDWVDGALMPNKAHAENVAEAIFFDKTKKYHTISGEMTDIYPFIEPGNLFTFPGYPNSRVETVNISGGGTTFTACVLP